MKILHFDFDDLESPVAGGQAVRTFEINRRLAKRGHDITVVTLDYKGAKNLTKEGIQYERTGSQKLPWGYFTYFKSIPKLIREHDFDLILEDNMPPCFGFSPLYTNKTVISQIQSLFSKEYFKILSIVEKYGARFYKNFIVLTQEAIADIKKLNKKARIELIPNGLTTIRTLEHTNNQYALFLGRIEFYQKGLDYLLKSAQILQKKAPDLKIIIAGTGFDIVRLKKEIEKKQLKNIEYIGKVSGENKEKIISECSMLLQPSRFETLPFSILEASSYGKPTVCFDIKNLHALIDKKIGLNAPAFKIDLYAEAILQLWQNKSLRLELGKNAYNWSKEHLWDDIAKKQEDFYFECLDKGSRIQKSLHR